MGEEPPRPRAQTPGIAEPALQHQREEETLLLPALREKHSRCCALVQQMVLSTGHPPAQGDGKHQDSGLEQDLHPGSTFASQTGHPRCWGQCSASHSITARGVLVMSRCHCPAAQSHREAHGPCGLAQAAPKSRCCRSYRSQRLPQGWLLQNRSPGAALEPVKPLLTQCGKGGRKREQTERTALPQTHPEAPEARDGIRPRRLQTLPEGSREEQRAERGFGDIPWLRPRLLPSHGASTALTGGGGMQDAGCKVGCGM